jgi:hypothetical protein
MGCSQRKPTPETINRVHVLYDDRVAVFDLSASATLADLAAVLEDVGKGHKALCVNVAVDSHCLPV